MRLEVKYWREEIDSELDEKISCALADLGFERWASGYDLKERRRDLCFEKISTREGD